MSASIEQKQDAWDVVVDDTELTDEEVDQVVGGLDRGWWPDTDDSTTPQQGF